MRTLACIAVAATLAASPLPALAGSNEILGTIIGGAAGGYAGSHIGKGTGRLAATAGGAVAGALIGNSVGSSMDRVDRLERNHGGRYNGPEPAPRHVYPGHPGKPPVYGGPYYGGPRRPPPQVYYYYAPPPPRVVYRPIYITSWASYPVVREYYHSGYGRYCREYSTTIYVDGYPRPGYGTACLEPDGQWRIMN